MKEYKNKLLKLREGAKKAYFNYLFRYNNGFIRNNSLSNENTLWTTVNRGLGLITLQIAPLSDDLVYFGIFGSGIFLTLILAIILRGIFLKLDLNRQSLQPTLFEILCSFILKIQYVMYYPLAIIYGQIIFGKNSYFLSDSSSAAASSSSTATPSWAIPITYVGWCLQILLKLMISYHDKEIRFKFEDFLSRPVSYFFLQQGFLEVLIMFIFAMDIPIALYLFQSAYGLLSINEYMKAYIFMDAGMNRLFVQLQCILVCANLFLFCEMNTFQPELVCFLILAIFPIALRLSQAIDSFKNQSPVHSTTTSADNLTITQIEQFIRQSWNYSTFQHQEYLSKMNGIYFSTIRQQHSLACVKENCFCHKFYEQECQGDQTGQNAQMRKQFYELNIAACFQHFLKHKQPANQAQSARQYNSLCFSYLAFLIDVLENPILSMQYLTKLKQLQFTLREEVVLFFLEKQIGIVFKSIINRDDKDNWVQVILFDEILEILSTKLVDVFQKLKALVVFVGQEYFELEGLDNQTSEILRSQVYIEQLIGRLFKYNPSNRRLHELISVYINQFDFRRKHLSSFLTAFARLYTNKLGNDFIIMVSQSCVIFSSLLKPIGIIKSFSANTKVILDKIPITEHIGKNCSGIIPRQISKHHDCILKNYVENGKHKYSQPREKKTPSEYSSHADISSPSKLLFFTSPLSCLIYPMKVQFQVAQISEEDFGVCSLITKDSSGQDYVLFDGVLKQDEETMFGFTHFTERVYNLLFKRFYKTEDAASKLDAQLVIPEVMVALKDLSEQMMIQADPLKSSDAAQAVTTLAFFPISESQMEIFKLEKVFHNPYQAIGQLLKELNYQEDVGIAEIECSLSSIFIQAVRQRVFYLEVKHLRVIKKTAERVIALNHFRQKMQIMHNIDLSDLEEVEGFQQVKSAKAAQISKQPCGATSVHNKKKIIKNGSSDMINAGNNDNYQLSQQNIIQSSKATASPQAEAKRGFAEKNQNLPTREGQIKASALSSQEMLLDSPNLLIYSSSNRQIEEQIHSNQPTQSQQIKTASKGLIQAAIEEAGNDLFQIDEDNNDLLTDVLTQTILKSQGSLIENNRSEKIKSKLNYDSSQFSSLYGSVKSTKKEDKQGSQRQGQIIRRTASSDVGDTENEKEPEGRERKSSEGSRIDKKGVRPRLSMSNSQISNSKIVQSLFKNYQPQFRTQYSDNQVEEIVNSSDTQHDAILRRKSIQQSFYKLSILPKAQLLNPESLSNNALTNSQICTSVQISEVKTSQIGEECDDPSEILSEQFLEEIQKEFNQDNQSITSSRNELNQKKKRVINLIYSPTVIGKIQILKLASIFLLISLLVSVVLNYYSIYSQIDLLRNDTLSSKSVIDLFFLEGMLIQSASFLKLNSYLQWNITDNLSAQDLSNIQGDLSLSLTRLSTSLQQMLSLGSSSNIIEIIQNMTSGMKEFTDNGKVYDQKYLICYDLIRRRQQFFRYSLAYVFFEEEQIHFNYIQIMNDYLIILEQQKYAREANLQGINSSLSLSFSLTIIMSVLNVLILLPFHIIAVKIKDSQLKICSHFSKDKLHMLYIKIQQNLLASSFAKGDQGQIKSSSKFNQTSRLGQNIQWKKRASSTTNSLSFLTLSFIFFILSLFVLLSAYPLFSFFYGNKFVNELSGNLQNLEIVQYSRCYLSMMSTFSSLQFYMAENEQYQQSKLATYVQEIETQSVKAYTQASGSVKQMQTFVSYFEDTQLIDFDSLRKAFLVPLQGSLCSHVDSGFFSEKTVTEEQCPIALSNLFSKGLIFILTDLFKEQDLLFQTIAARNTDPAGFINFEENSQPFQLLLKQRIINLFGEEYSEYALIAVESMIKFVSSLQFAMLLYAIFQIIFVQFIFQMRHFIKVSKQIQNSKLVFSVFSADSILENSYFLSYFKDQLQMRSID